LLLRCEPLGGLSGGVRDDGGAAVDGDAAINPAEGGGNRDASDANDAAGDRSASDAACEVGLTFDGISHFVNVPYDLSLSTLRLTIEAWLKLDPVAVAGEMDVVSHHDHALRQGYVLFVDTKLKLRIYDGSTWGEVASLRSVPADGQWHHVAGAFDGTTARVFIDGASEGIAFGIQSAVNYGGRLAIGRAAHASVSLLAGKIDEVRLSNDALYVASFTPARRMTAATATLGLWHFDEGTGQAVASETGRLSGTLGSSSSLEASDPAWDACNGR
jgi:hypothetical protein